MNEYKAVKRAKTINAIVHSVTELVALTLAFVWFGWEGFAVAFFIIWSANAGNAA